VEAPFMTWESIRAATITCSFCPNLCLHACPVSNGERRATLSPWAKMSLARWVASEQVPLGIDEASVFYACTGCRACTDACLLGIPVADTLLEARELTARAGHHPWPQALFEPETGPLEAAAHELGAGETFEPSAVYLPGCEVLREWPEAVRDALVAFDALGMGPIALAPPDCCGYLLHTAGFADAFVARALRFARRLPPAAPLLVGPGTCEHALELAHDRAGAAGPELRHATAAVADALDAYSGTIAPLAGDVALLDGCFHLRREGQADPARRILSRVVGGAVLPLRWSGKESHCCGAGGALPLTHPRAAEEAARIVLGMARDAGATSLVTFDPRCGTHLRAHTEGTGVHVVSGLSLVARAVAGSGAGAR
jgi:Fe-S oxidoreductase